MDFLNTGVRIAGLICLMGTIWRVRGWFSRSWLAPWQLRAHHAGKKKQWSLGRGMVTKALTFLQDILLLGRTARTNPVRWVMHMLIFYGFMGLLLFHALDDQITLSLFDDYQPTLNPWQWLRNLFGLMVLAGVVLAGGRRIANSNLRALSRIQDWGLLVLVAAICLSGFLLEAGKIISPAVFERMVEEYAGLDQEEHRALQTLWVREFGLVAPAPISLDPAVLEAGRGIHEDSCATCHAPMTSAFVSLPLARALRPMAGFLNSIGGDRIFWYAHVLLCLAGLALLPFGKWFHVLATPANLVMREGRQDSVAPDKALPRGNMANGLGLDACTRCGECSLHCSVRPAFVMLGNPDILPSEKLISLRNLTLGKPLDNHALETLVEGSRICTQCMRCTTICPAGIDLQRLWMESTRKLHQQGRGGPNTDIRKFPPATWARAFSSQEAGITSTPAGEGLADRRASFWSCIQCTTCTSVCPVVAVSENPTRDLDLTPQQIMNLLRMGLKEETMAARMVWSCTTCYKCQEYCPQNIPVADILYELRNIASTRLRHRRFQHPSHEEVS
ncbi:4Fe-4S dicluster domain-containing protein [Desulfoplanes formicivorans]|uniref:Heterodisulfide reductase subunit C-like protein n=1 Tax=Desulfoplanes formicivorans TaxID=1592317 RepID=A0A194AC93_9BACT|nr:4Fe-4S dicluster domain-containing protein [Desulfoplanes formicivorans]GAU07762.1 heterodisulfide reductase subunit C-like protein [Desulfoplanes formicivorans]